MTMQTHEWEDFKATLTQRRDDLQRVIADAESVVDDQIRAESDARVDFNHPADALKGDADYEKELTLLRQQQGELRLVEAALARIGKGTFGSCQDCGGEIEMARLVAVPYARCCLDCQEQDDARPHPYQPSATV